MPRQDRTGPYGQGPVSGKGFGPCGLGLGWRKGYSPSRGVGRYFNWNWHQTKEEELEDVKKEEEGLTK